MTTNPDIHAAALRLLSARERTRHELIAKLTDRDFDRADAESEADRLEAAGLINDAEFARRFVQTQLATKPAGRALLAAKLARRGITGETADTAIAQALAGRDLVADALKLARARLRTIKPGTDPDAVKRRLLGALARRGFNAETARRAFEQALGEHLD